MIGLLIGLLLLSVSSFYLGFHFGKIAGLNQAIQIVRRTPEGTHPKIPS